MSVTWRPLEDGFVRINFDLAHNCHQFRSISGLVARNSNGEVLASQATLEKEITSSFAAEACACTRVVRLGIQMGVRRIKIEGDALTIIKKCQSNSVDKSEIRAYIKDIK
ncbi:hypothetical protein Gohar_007098 [Gossypium harknessii]|uniref:RNase H type-1 domain-containing protein n=1 Tax=Gossypium harknessii TaxID=34285 RepID=A0A7J9GFQ1_9ROSI|nr:hypothetical protein [Gossypium harknessii]